MPILDLIAPLLSLAMATVVLVFTFSDRGRRIFSRRFRDGNHVRQTIAALAAAIALLKLVQIAFHHQRALVLVVNIAALAVLAYVGVLLLRTRISPASGTSHPQVVLAIGAHPDDLELACFATLSKLADSGSQVHLLVLSDGSRGGDEEIRLLEVQKGARFLDAASITQYRFPDTRLADHAYELVQAIEKRINDLHPDLIITHSSNDQHQDHQAAHIATLRAARQHPSIICFESPSATRNFLPSFFVDISDYVATKEYAVATHRNQVNKPYMQAEKLRGMALFRGSQAKVRHAEGFEVVRMLDTWQTQKKASS